MVSLSSCVRLYATFSFVVFESKKYLECRKKSDPSKEKVRAGKHLNGRKNQTILCSVIVDFGGALLVLLVTWVI